MDIFFYNSLSKKKELFLPLDKNNVKMYVCGPTVYDRAHIGNARPVIVFDLIFRILISKYGKNSVNYVRNFTDVDDKINQKSKESSKSIKEITNETIKWYYEDMDYLNALRPTFSPRATEYINQMISQILILIEKQHAYQNQDGTVFFSTKTYKEYGLLSKLSKEKILLGSRVEINKNKKDPSDFVLWKPSDKNDPGWNSPWGFGRPGWHIECSSMIKEIFGYEIDIHGGGQDLIFPHHENEIAQSKCAFPNKKFVKFWMHNGLVQIEGKKMSKSLGNFLTVNDLVKKEISGDVIRFILLSSHYRQPLDWQNKRIKEVEGIINKWSNSTKEISAEDNFDNNFLSALYDDVNTPLAISFLHKFANNNDWANLKKCSSLLGFEFSSNEKNENDLDEDLIVKISDLIEKRNIARIEKDFSRADEIRNKLLDCGILLKDNKKETVWEFINKLKKQKLREIL